MDQVAEKPFLVLWRQGDVQAVYMDLTEGVSSANLKRGLASLFQYRTLDDELAGERDASGLCRVTYVSTGPKTVEKRKTGCTHSNLPPPRQHPNPAFGVVLDSTRNSTYVLTDSLLPELVIDHEAHKMTLSSKSDIGTTVVSERTFVRVSEFLNVSSVVQGESAKHAIMHIQPGYREMSVELQPEPVACPDAGCLTVNSCACSKDVIS